MGATVHGCKGSSDLATCLRFSHFFLLSPPVIVSVAAVSFAAVVVCVCLSWAEMLLFSHCRCWQCCLRNKTSLQDAIGRTHAQLLILFGLLSCMWGHGRE